MPPRKKEELIDDKSPTVKTVMRACTRCGVVQPWAVTNAEPADKGYVVLGLHCPGCDTDIIETHLLSDIS